MKYSWIELNLDLSKKRTDCNGYSLVWCPDHPRSHNGLKNSGWVLEHIVVYEYFNKLTIPEGYFIHHLDGHRQHNSPNNLIMLSNADHARLHEWIRHGMPSNGQIEETKYCNVCMKWLDDRLHDKYCSNDCRALDQRRVVRPSLEQLLSELNQASFSELGRKYGVSDNAIRKWLKAYGMTIEEIKSLTNMSKINTRVQKGQYAFSRP